MPGSRLPGHATRARYSVHGCRCDECRTAHREYEQIRTRQKAYGTWKPHVDAEPARLHVRELMARGMGWRRIAKVSGVANGTINKLLYGVPGQGRPPAQRIRRETAERLLAIDYSAELLADGAFVDATGTWRRIRALVSVGWPKVHIARALGSHGQGLQLHEHLVLASTARRVAELYDTWWDADPTQHGVQTAQVGRARRYASSRGWAPPMAWDDDTLDNPEAQPHQDARRAISSAERREEIEHLASFGTSTAEIAKRVGLSTDYVRGLLGGWANPTRDKAA
ncbi:hypothetical protein ACFYWY_27515 [Streptomyces sp. NPDC002870]|uniref:hypothetical protein n=1 Tax=Streptomyces sp. NPDC002870 TaxID=3364666 RepID=UPI0036C175CB